MQSRLWNKTLIDRGELVSVDRDRGAIPLLSVGMETSDFEVGMACFDLYVS